jgi:hypothetical protein
VGLGEKIVTKIIEIKENIAQAAYLCSQYSIKFTQKSTLFYYAGDKK